MEVRAIVDILIPFFSGAAGAAICSGIVSIVQMVIRRRWERSDKGSAQTKALRYLMLYIMMQTAKGHIRDGEISMDDRRQLHKWHTLYHDGLGGNGDMDKLMAEVDKLPLSLED